MLMNLPLPRNAIDALRRSGITALNPPQRDAVKPLFAGKNLVVSAPTASGKTLIAELAILRAFLDNKKSLYLVPLKALASEKYDDFRSRYEPLGMRIALSTGDIDSQSSYLGGYDLVIVSNEKADSLLRHEAKWLRDIHLLVADEIHVLDDASRGPTLEVVLTRMRDYAKQIIALSATIQNAAELAEWLGASLVQSDYRPVKLHKGVCYPDGDGAVIDLIEKQKRIDSSDEMALCKDALALGKQALVFVATRRSAEAAAEKIGKHISTSIKADGKKQLRALAGHIENALPHPTRQCRRLAGAIANGAAFHHAGLVAKQRKLIEDAFRDGTLKAIAATATLALGVNLPAWRVVVRDVRRYSGYGSSFIPVMEVQQMCVPYDSQVLMSDGTTKKIGDLVEQDANEIISIEPTKLNSKPANFIRKFRRESNEFVKIMAGGNELMATPEHPILILRNGRPEWLKISELKKGERVGMISNIKINAQFPRFLDLLNRYNYVKGAQDVVKYLLIKSNLTQRRAAAMLKIPHKTLKSYSYNKAIPLHIIKELAKLANCNSEELSNLLAKKHFKSKSGNEIILPKVLDEKFAWFLGIFAVEGSIVNYTGKGKWKNVAYRKLKISSVDDRIVSKLENILSDFGVKYYRSSHKGGFKGSKTSMRLEIANQVLADIINNLGVPSGAKSYTIGIGKVYRFSDNLIGAYLAGVFDGDGNFDTKAKSLRLSSRSKKLIEGCKNLLLRLNIHSCIYPEGQSYVLGIYRKSDVGKFLKRAPSIRFENQSIKYVINTRPVINIGDVKFERVKFIERVRIKLPIPVYNLSVENNENFICNEFVVHNCGRAGRPRYDAEGEALLVAKSEDDAEDLKDRYIFGDAEPVYSKLSLEATLRMHTLSLVASGMESRSALDAFFANTFFAHQYGDAEEVMEKVSRILKQLAQWRFITSSSSFISSEFVPAFDLKSDVAIKATPLGRRVAQLYLDPQSAWHIISNMRVRSDIAHLITLCLCAEMRPLLCPKKGDDIEESVPDDVEVPNVWDIEYENFMAATKTAMMLGDWMDEAGEDALLDKYGIAPGELYVKTRNVEWLLYAASEFAMLLGRKDMASDFRRLQLRAKHGVRAELLKLVRIRGIGRVRARLLYKAGVASAAQMRAKRAVVEAALGKKMAEKVLKEVG